MVQIPDELLHWADEIEAAVTICDKNAKILYMNEKSRETFARHGDIIGHDLLQYHPPKAVEQIKHMLSTGETNTYKITKNGREKIIHQTPWRQNGEIMGLVEFSIVLPEDMPHYVR